MSKKKTDGARPRRTRKPKSTPKAAEAPHEAVPQTVDTPATEAPDQPERLAVSPAVDAPRSAEVMAPNGLPEYQFAIPDEDGDSDAGLDEPGARPGEQSFSIDREPEDEPPPADNDATAPPPASEDQSQTPEAAPPEAAATDDTEQPEPDEAPEPDASPQPASPVADAEFDANGLPPGFEESLHAHARQLNVNVEHLKRFGTPRQQAVALRTFVSHLQRSDAPAPPPQAPRPPQTAPPAPAAPQSPAGFSLDETLGAALSVEEYGQELSKFHTGVRAMYEHLQGLVNEVRSAQQRDNDQMAATLEQFAAANFLEQADRELSRLGPEYGDLFGEQLLSELPEDSPQAENRKKVLTEAFELLELHRRYRSDPNATLPTPRKFVRRAAYDTFGTELQAATRRGIAGQVKKRNGAMLARPSQRQPAPAPRSGHQDAVQAAAEWMDAHDVLPGGGLAGEMDQL